MGARGRKSASALSLVARAEEVLVVKRPDPPDCLSDEGRAEWREVVNAVPADHFSRAIYPVLEAYCRHAVAARKIDQMARALEDDPVATRADYERLLVMHERESKALATLAVRLGIASATHLRTKPATGGGRKPWEKPF
jgi:phage terminase small subunit